MRFLRFDIEQFRSIEDEWLPADGLVVLFGPNSAGKTSVLEAVRFLLTQTGTFRSDPADLEGQGIMGSVAFDLPAADVVGTGDERVYGSLLRGEFIREGLLLACEGPWGLLRDEQAIQIEKLDTAEVISLLADVLDGSGSAGAAEDRALLARSIFASSAVFFSADGNVIEMWTHGPSLPVGTMDAATRIAADGHGNDALRTIARSLDADGVALIGQVSTTANYVMAMDAIFPAVVVLDGDYNSLSAELQDAVRVIHDRWLGIEMDFDRAITSSDVLEGNYEIGARILSGHLYEADRWLEGQSSGGELVPVSVPDSSSLGAWFRVRPSVLATAKLIEAEANKVVPTFVSDQGTIGIEILPVSVWGSGPPRIRATFAAYGDEPRDLKIVGAGTSRWVAAAVRVACRRLKVGRQVVTDDVGAMVSDEEEKRRIIKQARRDLLSSHAVYLEPTEAATVYIVDEPETHLHPAALQSVRKWLTELAATAATVLIATHSPALLDSDSQRISRVLVTRKGQRTHLRQLTGALAHELARVADDLGLTRGELLLMTRLALFVEGPHDQIILDEWFGDALSAAGIRVFPTHGVDNLPNLADSEITAALGIRIATLSDDTSLSRISDGSIKTRGEMAVARLLEEARRAGTQVHATGLSAPDILYYLDESVCQRKAPAFPGWTVAQTSRAAAGSRAPWKKWIEQKYGLGLDRETIRELARTCRQEGKVPAELSLAIRELIAYATNANPKAP